jgi:hypothetical protein
VYRRVEEKTRGDWNAETQKNGANEAVECEICCSHGGFYEELNL